MTLLALVPAFKEITGKLRLSNEKNCKDYIKKPGILLSTALQVCLNEFFLGLSDLLLRFIKIGKINALVLKSNLYIMRFLFQKQSAVRRCSGK